ncbi:MAG TPA: phosphoribosylanthranilate isomerase [Rhizomicrobium sp.]|nr:phosphoribosylanthranilate isomerase [Rhizomicrobium sp.]
MPIRVKICGITSADAADAAVRAGADFAGLAFHPGSPRNLKPEQAASLAARLRGRLRIVALVADAKDDAIAAAVAAANPDFIQLHGRETPDRTGEIRARFGKPVIKAIAVADASDLSQVAAYEMAADMLLFDAKAPERATRPGGHGTAFDWQLLRGRSFSRPWLLAGGLDAGNVARAIRSAQAPGVDTSSGVESAPGVKSPELIRAFVANARTPAEETQP